MKLSVNTSTPYQILIERGTLDALGTYLKDLFPEHAKAFVITDSNVAPIYLDRVRASLEASGYKVYTHIFPAGEDSKRLSTIQEMYSHMAEAHLSRTDFAVALGGGVTGDMAGFAAATFLRGIKFVQVPTSLLAQVDSSVGGKTGVDLPEGKNMVGAFWQPSFVLIDPDTLHTLPPVFFADGMGEVIKYGCIRSKDLFNTLLEAESLAPILESILYECVDIKRRIVENDERDLGERMLLNFGHTFGHALERFYQYKTLTHGAAVGIGMVQITKLSEAAGLTKEGCAAQIEALLKKYNLPTEDSAEFSTLLEYTKFDKKNLNAKLNLVLLKKIGDGFVHCVTQEELSALGEGHHA